MTTRDKCTLYHGAIMIDLNEFNNASSFMMTRYSACHHHRHIHLYTRNVTH